MTRCPRCSEENPDRARFCLACGLALEREEQTGGGEERRLVTAVFVDLVGSTAHGDRRDPEDVRSRLVPYHARVRIELERFGGTVEKFIGDAVVALFGAPIANEDDPERAVRAAFAVREATAELNEADAWLALGVRIGVATGEALVRPRATEGEALAMGDVMNTAARVQGAAAPGAIVVGVETFRATEHAVDYRPLERVTVKGKRDPLELWEAVDLKEAPERRHSDSPFVGRRRELAALGHQWRRVRTEGVPATAVVLAEAGTGKTRLLAAFSEQLGAPAFWGRCLAYGGDPYAPAAEILAAADAGELPHGELTKGEFHWGIRRALERVAEEPVVVVFEDLHWADAALLELLGALEEAAAPILILGSARPDLLDREPSFALSGKRRLVLDLPPLTAAESETLAGELLAARVGSEALAPILRAAHGNPLFIEETVRMLADRGLPAPAGEGEAVPMPPSLRSMIGARLDRLPEREKHLAQRAAVVGGSFWPSAIASLNGTADDVEAGLEALAALDVAEERPTSGIRGEREFAFKHVLIREVAYERLPKGLRAELHVRCADWFASRQERDEFAEMKAYHLEQACRLASEIERSPVAAPTVAAAEALRVAAEKAERREGLKEADRFYARALSLVGDEHPAAAVELRLRRARVLNALGNLEEASERLRAVVDDASSLGLAGLRGAALVALGNCLQKLGRGEEAGIALADAKAIAEETGDTKLEVQALFELSALDRDFTGEIEAAIAKLERALELAASLDDRPALAEGELRKAFLLTSAGDLVQAEQACVRTAEIGSELDSRREQSRATFMRAFIAYQRGRPEEAERLALEAQEWFERTGENYFRVQNLRALSQYVLARDDPVEAERLLREGLELAEPSGGWLVADLSSALVQLLVDLGRLDEAEELSREALAEVPTGDPAARALASVAAARVAAARGDREATRRHAADALAILDDLAHVFELMAGRVELGRALAAVGDLDQAAEQLRQAGERASEIGATTLLARAEIALSELENRPS